MSLSKKTSSPWAVGVGTTILAFGLTIYRDYYKFHYGFSNRLLTLAVLVVPHEPVKFFPKRNPASIANMASFGYALEHMSAITIPVPVLLVGLLPEN